jgi:hypothetical protein
MSFRRLVRQYWRSGPYISPDGVLHLLSSDRSATIRFSLAFILELIETSHFDRQQTPVFLRSIEVGHPPRHAITALLQNERPLAPKSFEAFTASFLPARGNQRGKL